MYKLKISRFYKEDISSSYNYIKYKLEAPMAAHNLKIDDDNKHIKIIRFLYNKRNWMNILKEKTYERIS